MPSRYSDAEYAAAARALSADKWSDENGDPALPSLVEKVEVGERDIPVGNHLHDATKRNTNGTLKAILGPEVKAVLEEKRFGNYLIRLGHNKWTLDTATPKKWNRKKGYLENYPVPDRQARLGSQMSASLPAYERGAARWAESQSQDFWRTAPGAPPTPTSSAPSASRSSAPQQPPQAHSPGGRGRR